MLSCLLSISMSFFLQHDERKGGEQKERGKRMEGRERQKSRGRGGEGRQKKRTINVLILFNRRRLPELRRRRPIQIKTNYPHPRPIQDLPLMLLARRLRATGLMQIQVRRQPDGEADVQLTAVFFPLTRGDGVDGHEDVCLAQLDGLPSIYDRACCSMLGKIHRDGIDLGFFSVVPRGDGADCGE